MADHMSIHTGAWSRRIDGQQETLIFDESTPNEMNRIKQTPILLSNKQQKAKANAL